MLIFLNDVNLLVTCLCIIISILCQPLCLMTSPTSSIEANLEILSQAGALGALLALVGVDSGKNDSQVHKDAATALSYLVALDDIKLRLLKSPDGLRALFYMTRSPNVGVKRAAVKTLQNLSKLEEAQREIVLRGGLKYILSLCFVKDEKTKRRAARLLRQLGANPANKERMVDPTSLQHLISLITDSTDIVLKKDLIILLTELADYDDRNKEVLVAEGVLTPLLYHLNLSLASKEIAKLVISCLSLLTHNEVNQLLMVQQGVVGTLLRYIFEDLKFCSIATSRSSTQMSARKSVGGRNDKDEHISLEIVRGCMNIFLDLVKHPANRDVLLEWGLS